jgi:hypothetical protein
MKKLSLIVLLLATGCQTLGLEDEASFADLENQALQAEKKFVMDFKQDPNFATNNKVEIGNVNATVAPTQLADDVFHRDLQNMQLAQGNNQNFDINSFRPASGGDINSAQMRSPLATTQQGAANFLTEAPNLDQKLAMISSGDSFDMVLPVAQKAFALEPMHPLNLPNTVIRNYDIDNKDLTEVLYELLTPYGISVAALSTTQKMTFKNIQGSLAETVADICYTYGMSCYQKGNKVYIADESDYYVHLPNYKDLLNAENVDYLVSNLSNAFDIKSQYLPDHNRIRTSVKAIDFEDVNSFVTSWQNNLAFVEYTIDSWHNVPPIKLPEGKTASLEKINSIADSNDHLRVYHVKDFSILNTIKQSIENSATSSSRASIVAPNKAKHSRRVVNIINNLPLQTDLTSDFEYVKAIDLTNPDVATQKDHIALGMNINITANWQDGKLNQIIEIYNKHLISMQENGNLNTSVNTPTTETSRYKNELASNLGSAVLVYNQKENILLTYTPRLKRFPIIENKPAIMSVANNYSVNNNKIHVRDFKETMQKVEQSINDLPQEQGNLAVVQPENVMHLQTLSPEGRVVKRATDQGVANGITRGDAARSDARGVAEQAEQNDDQATLMQEQELSQQMRASNTSPYTYNDQTSNPYLIKRDKDNVKTMLSEELASNLEEDTARIARPRIIDVGDSSKQQLYNRRDTASADDYLVDEEAYPEPTLSSAFQKKMSEN